MNIFRQVFHRTFSTRFASQWDYLWPRFSQNYRQSSFDSQECYIVSASGVANRSSTGLESSQFSCPIADELTFDGFPVYFARFCWNFSYFSFVLSLFGITLSTNRCELPPLNATICHLPQTWKKFWYFKNRFRICHFFPFHQWRRCMYFEKHFFCFIRWFSN